MLNLLNQLAATSGTNDKIALLKSYVDNPVVRAVFLFAYNPRIKYWIKKRPPVSPNNGITVDLIGALSSIKVNICNRELTGNEAIEYVSMILGKLPVDDQEVLYRIIERDLKCGVSAKTVNKIWKDLIPEYPVLLCGKFNEKTEKNIKYPAIFQCLSEDWVLNTTEGNMTIKQLIESDIKDIKVKSFNHHTNKVEYNTVLDKFVNKQTIHHKWYKLKMENGEYTKPLTGNHLIWCINKDAYIRVDELSSSDIILVDV
jgi:hypothetical protein